MPAPKLKIVRVPLEEPIPDIKPHFDVNLGDLHLEMLENKLKLKKGLPPIPMRNAVKPDPSKKSQPKPIKRVSTHSASESDAPKATSKTTPKAKLEPKATKTKPKPAIDDELVNALGMSETDHETADVADATDVTKSKRRSANKKSSDTLRGGDDEPPRDEPLPEPEPDPPLDEKPKDDAQRLPPAEDVPVEDVPEDDVQEVDDANAEPQKTPEEIEEEEREEFIVKLRILKKSYPDYDFPPYSADHTDTKTLKRIYNQSFRETSLDENVEWYQTILAAAFIGIGMAGKKLGLPFEDFASSQMKKMKKYRKLLFELGEKSYVNFMESWPVEIRLFGMVLLDAGLFWLGKVGIGFLGVGAGDILAMLTGTHVDKPATAKPRMRGPKTKPEEIKRMASKDD